MAKKAEATQEETVQEETVQEEAVQDTAQDTAPAPYDPWQDMREVYIPMYSRGEQPTLEVAVNDRTFFIPKGQRVLVAAPLWEVIMEMQRAEKANEQYLQSNEKLKPTAGR